jgi:hypothetical protein
VHLATVSRRSNALFQAVVAHDRCNSQAVAGKYASAPARLSSSVPLQIALGPHCFLITPERK